MACKSSHCECNAEARAACDARLSRKSVQQQLDDYDNRIRCLQAGRANIQRTLDTLPVEVCPVELRRLQDRSVLLGEIEAEVIPALAPHRDRTQAGQHLLSWFRQSSILRGQRI
ncbi:hypothetical protein [Pseudomonas phage Bertil]|uniref:Uncharacterized protein n=1 Tax=Pseudomonas phage Bertil TaxID=2801385 RepID=A0A7T8IW63_9CAUD|nr:hypothetical protein [Pseudomonas phage Bertil]QQO90884.1 hypothetical protein [Pseudomonas phage Strit]